MPTDTRQPGGFRQLTQQDRKAIRQRRQQELAANLGITPSDAADAIDGVVAPKPRRKPNAHWSGRIHYALRGLCPPIAVFRDRGYGEAFIDGWKAECARSSGLSLNAMYRRKRGGV